MKWSAASAVIACILTCPKVSWSQDGEEEPVVESREVTTHGEHVDGVMRGRAQRVERVEREAMRRLGATNVAEALAATSAGVQVDPTGTTAGMIIAGLPASQVIVLRDGLPIASAAGSPQGPIVDLSAIAIAPESIERIDVYRGVGPIGSAGASGVVIDIVSRPRPRHSSVLARGQWTGSAQQEAIIDSQYAVQGDAAITRSWSAQASIQGGAQSAIDVNDDGAIDRPSSDTLAADAAVTYRPQPNSFVRIQAVGTRAEHVLGSQTFDDRIARSSTRARLKGRWWPHEDVRLEHHTDVGRDRSAFTKEVRSSGAQVPKTDTTLDAITQSISATHFSSSHDLSVEISARTWSVAREEQADTYRAADARAGLGVSDTWYASESWELFGALFAQSATDFGSHLQGQVGAAYAVTPQVIARASFARSARLPTPEELYFPFDHNEIGYIVTNNDALSPEVIHSSEAGMVWTSGAKTLGVEVAGFYHDMRDLIVAQPIETTAQGVAVFTYQNVQRAHSAGGRLTLQANDLFAGLGLLANYSWTPLASDQATGERLINRAEHATRVELRGAWGDASAWIDATTRSSLAVPDGQPSAPAYVLCGAGGAYRIAPHTMVRFDANNLLDQTNATWGPMPGISALLSVQIGYESL